MQTLSQLLGKKYKKSLAFLNALEIIQRSWEDIVGELSSFLVPENIYYNELVLACTNSAWVSEVDYFKEQIVTKCNAMLVQRNSRIKIQSVKVFISSDMSITVKKKDQPNQVFPQSIEDRIRLNIKKSARRVLFYAQKMQKSLGYIDCLSIMSIDMMRTI